jgi:hypothetical protein
MVDVEKHLWYHQGASVSISRALQSNCICRAWVQLPGMAVAYFRSLFLPVLVDTRVGSGRQGYPHSQNYKKTLTVTVVNILPYVINIITVKIITIITSP